MDEATFLIFILFIGGSLGLLYVIYYNTFQKYLIKINEVEEKIDIALREQYDILKKAADFVNEQVKEKIMADLTTLEKAKLSSFELERKLISLTREFYNLKISHRNLIKTENFINIDFSLKENDAKLEGYVSYYNDNISKFNKLVRMFPSNIIAKLSRFKEKTFYDGKNMYDNDVNDFKL